MAAAPLAINTSQSYLQGTKLKQTKSFISQLYRQFGVKLHDDSIPKPQQQLFFKAECYHHPFDAVIKLRQLGLDWFTPSHGPIYRTNGFLGSHRNQMAFAAAGTSPLNNDIVPSRRCIVLDIEGTTTPITFVTDVLFPYARDSVGKHLELTYDTAETQDDIIMQRAQIGELKKKKCRLMLRSAFSVPKKIMFWHTTLPKTPSTTPRS